MKPDFICDVCHQNTPEYHYGGQCRECHSTACSNCISDCTICGRFICRSCARIEPHVCKNKDACDEYTEERMIRRVLGNLASTGDDKKDAEIRHAYTVCPYCNALSKTEEIVKCANCDKILCGKCARTCPGCHRPYCRVCKVAAAQCSESCKGKPPPQSPPPSSPPSRRPTAISRKKKEPGSAATPKPGFPGVGKFFLWFGGRASKAHPIAINSPLGLIIFLPLAYLVAVLGSILFSPVICAIGIMLQAAGMFMSTLLVRYGSIFLAGFLFFGFEPQRPRLWILLCSGPAAGAFLEYHFNLLGRFYDYFDYHSYLLDNMCQIAVITTLLLTSAIDVEESIARKSPRRPFHFLMGLCGGVLSIGVWYLLYTRFYVELDRHGETYITPSVFFAATFFFFSMVATYFRLTERH